MAATSPIAAQAVVPLAQLARDVLRAVPAAAPFVAEWPESMPTRPVAPATLPVLRWLPQACACTVATTAGFVAAIADAASALAWRRSYAVADFGAAFLERYGWTEFIGTKGPIASDRIACGMLMLGPETIYPSHAHLAEELYLPLAGTALWQRGDAAENLVTPGMPVHHPPWMPHAMRTRDEPLIALYVWRGGDLGARPRIEASKP